MTTNLDELTLNTYPNEKKYLSYSFDIPYEPLDGIFAKISAYKGTRFFWQTPDRQFGLLGFGQNLIEDTKDWAIEELTNIKQEFFKNLFFLNTPEEHPLLFGSLPFDQKNQTKEPFWSTLENGSFILPSVLIKQVKQRLVVVLLLKNTYKTFKELKIDLDNRMIQIKQRLAKVPTSTDKNQVISEEELEVKSFIQSVKESTQKISAADSELKKVVLARQLKMKLVNFSVERLLLNLIKQQPNTYVFVLESADRSFIGATPERLIKATKDHFATASIAGSMPRGSNEEKDELYGKSLLKDFKNNLEHGVVVDRLTEQLDGFVDGNLKISNKKLLKNRDIQHLHLTLKGARKKKVPFTEVVKTLHPSPALGGEPKKLAMKWLAEKEPTGRGLYGAPIGWWDLIEDAGELAVGIRSGVFSQTEGLLYAGCGIVAESNPETERLETKLKFQPMLRGVKE